jgi:hypothetical protein
MIESPLNLLEIEGSWDAPLMGSLRNTGEAPLNPADCEAHWAVFQATREFRKINKRGDLTEEDKTRLKDIYVKTQHDATARLLAERRIEELRLRGGAAKLIPRWVNYG